MEFMKNETLRMTAVWALMTAGLPAQNFSFQQVGSFASPGSVPQLGEVWQSQWINGKPYSATVVTHTVQTFANGTNVDHTETGLVFRDAQGRTRHELNGAAGSNASGIFIGNTAATVVSIDDPVAGLEYNYNVPNPGAGGRGRGGGPPRQVYNVRSLSPNILANETKPGGMSPYDLALQQVMRPGKSKVPNSGRGGRGGRGGQGRKVDVENLGTQTVNGVTAQGVRVTNTIPAESIGNDRDIPVVTERWVASDLQVLVKSVYSDPRFGTTTYELTNISRTAPDPSLFQVPPGYKEQAKRGGDGGQGYGKGFSGTPVKTSKDQN
jgi:hypothetical protein